MDPKDPILPLPNKTPFHLPLSPSQYSRTLSRRPMLVFRACTATLRSPRVLHCRSKLACRFWITLGQSLYTVKLTNVSVPADDTNPVQNVEKTFQLTKVHMDLLAKPEFKIQVRLSEQSIDMGLNFLEPIGTMTTL
ncbi:hypothetical protein SSX86_012153 [Deinandra increscens subsp. villosa]|uniref:Uncharacterized protein n=1 Tax=Deinandra increscens subsp. villosa TaxID=3103831 RepID=A0AAP0D8T9_9ASTR